MKNIRAIGIIAILIVLISAVPSYVTPPDDHLNIGLSDSAVVITQTTGQWKQFTNPQDSVFVIDHQVGLISYLKGDTVLSSTPNPDLHIDGWVCFGASGASATEWVFRLSRTRAGVTDTVGFTPVRSTATSQFGSVDFDQDIHDNQLGDKYAFEFMNKTNTQNLIFKSASLSFN